MLRSGPERLVQLLMEAAGTRGRRSRRPAPARLAGARGLGLVLAAGAPVLMAACGPGPHGAAETNGAGPGWVDAAAAVRPSVHSVWGSLPVLGGERTAFQPIGTAFAISRDGLLLTAAHVVASPDDASAPYPRLHVLVQSDTGTALHPATVSALDPVRDLALLRIADSALVPVRWAGRLAPMGTPAATIGYGLPEGGIVETTDTAVTTEYTVVRRFSAGHTSSYRTLRAGDPSSNILEVDLFLFPGVSGGPTFGPDGRVLGVNRSHRLYRDGGPTSYGRITPRRVVAQFLAGLDAPVDTTRIFADPDGAP